MVAPYPTEITPPSLDSRLVNAMVASLQSRFLSAEQELLSAFTGGHSALSAFDATWTRLLEDYTDARMSKQVDPQTMSIAHMVASRVAVISDSLLSLDVAACELHSSLLTSVRTVLSQTNDQDSPTAHPHPSLDSIAGSWLVDNLYDPYPSSAVKSSMAEHCGRSVQTVQQWFSEARRRIGWTALSAEIYGGSRRATCADARLAYGDGEASRALQADIKRAFAAIQNNAQHLVHSDLLPSQKEFPEWDYEELLFSAGTEEQTKFDRLTPSHDLASSQMIVKSPSPSPLTPPSLFSDFDEEDMTPPPAIAGCKRHMDSSIDAPDTLNGQEVFHGDRPTKRPRHVSSSDPRSIAIHAASAQESPKFLQEECGHAGPSNSWKRSNEVAAISSHNMCYFPLPLENAASTPSSLVPLSRKRRLSDTCLHSAPKRPKGLLGDTRKHIVSNPLPTIDFDACQAIRPGEEPNFGFEMPSMDDNDWLGSSVACGSEQLSFGVIPDRTWSASLGSISPACQLDISDADLFLGAMAQFDLFAPSAVDKSHVPMDPTYYSPTSSSPSSVGSLPELSDYSSLDDWSQNWDQIAEVLRAAESSPISSTSSLLDSTTSFQFTSGGAFSSSQDDASRTLLGVDPSSTSDFLSNIDQFSSLHIPLEAML